MALTPKMRKFAEAICAGLSNKDAAITAGYAEGTASQAGSKLAKNPEIITYIEKLKLTQKLKPELKANDQEPKANVVKVERINPEHERVQGQFVGRDQVAVGGVSDPLEYLKTIWTDDELDEELRIKAAQIAMPYIHGKVGTKGKKETQAEDARDISSGAGKFATRAARKNYS